MRKLSESQKEFLLKWFFENDLHHYPGWKAIAEKLLETGKCIVAGNTCIWIGGIGNFINTKETNEAVGCLVYEFDIDYFFTSLFYKQVKELYMQRLLKDIEESKEKVVKLESQYKEIQLL
jgi:hypothetical protein